MSKVRCLINSELAGRFVVKDKDYILRGVGLDYVLVACNTGEYFTLYEGEYVCANDHAICEAYSFDLKCGGKHCPFNYLNR